MCKNCFEKEYLSFPTYKDFEEFDFELTKKLSIGRLKYIDNDGKYLHYGYSTYRCDNCGTIWWLNVPENAWRGFFAHSDTSKELINELEKRNKKGQVGCLVFFALVFIITFTMLFKNCTD